MSFLDKNGLTRVKEKIYAKLDLKLNTSLKGAANGLAELDGAGKVPSSQLPSYVDDVLEYANLAAFPATGETGKIYVAIDTGKTYRWSGSTYTEISSGTYYTFTGGTNKFTVTPSDGSPQDVTVTPSIALVTTSANGLMRSSDRIKLENMAMVTLGTCDTAGDVAAKAITITNTYWQLKVGSVIGVKFAYGNSASNVTLNVNETGAYPIYYANAEYTASSGVMAGAANRYTYYMFDGSYWVWFNYGTYQSNTQNTAGAGNAENTKLFLVGRVAQSTGTSQSNANVYIGSDNCLYSNGVKVLTAHQDISGLVPNTRTVNNHALSADVTLNAGDVGAVAVAQGAAHAGKFLMVNASGNVEPTSVPNANGVSF